MSALKNLMVCGLSLAVTFGLVGCDVEEECDEAGVCTTPDGGEGGAGGGAGGAGGGAGGGNGAVYDWILVIDGSDEENMAGTPGVDICGMTATCDGANVAAVAALLSPGDGELCDSVREGCSAERTDPNAARDDGSSCEGGSTPSDYVSLGLFGTLSVQFASDLQGCSVEIVELVGNDAESYDVFACDSSEATAGGCANNDGPIGGSANGGTITVNVP